MEEVGGRGDDEGRGGGQLQLLKVPSNWRMEGRQGKKETVKSAQKKDLLFAGNKNGHRKRKKMTIQGRADVRR